MDGNGLARLNLPAPLRKTRRWTSSPSSHQAPPRTYATRGIMTDSPSLTHRPMKNKAGTAAGNPRARADRASPTMNGNPNAQVCPICFHIHIHRGRGACFHPFRLYHLLCSAHQFRFSSRFHHFSMVAPAVCFSALLGFARWLLVPGARGLSAKFWVLTLRPGPWPCPRHNCSGRPPSG